RLPNRSAYRLNNFGAAVHATLLVTPRLIVVGSAGRIDRPHLSTPTGPNVTVPSTVDLFSEPLAPGVSAPPPFVHGELSIAADWRDGPSHPTHGAMYRASAARYSDRATGTYSFRRFEIEGTHFVPLVTNNWVLVLHGWRVFSAGD